MVHLYRMFGGVHLQKITWNLKIIRLKRKIIFLNVHVLNVHVFGSMLVFLGSRRFPILRVASIVSFPKWMAQRKRMDSKNLGTSLNGLQVKVSEEKRQNVGSETTIPSMYGVFTYMNGCF